jgi:hypothetical protein
VAACEQGNERAGSMHCEEFLDNLRTRQLPKKEIPPTQSAIHVLSDHVRPDTQNTATIKRY